MKTKYFSQDLAERLRTELTHRMSVTDLASAPDEIYYQACVKVTNDIMLHMRKKFWAHNLSAGKKQVYYLSMEFLLGKSLRNALFNLGIAEQMAEALATFDVKLENLYDIEPDAGLGNGGLGRLAACYLDAAAHEEYLATGYCILYEFGIFKQKIIDGWQTELPDNWLPGGKEWLVPKPGYEVQIRFGGEIKEHWENDKHLVQHHNYSTVLAVPFDIHMPGYDSDGISLLRVWQAKNPVGMDMESFNRGDFTGAFQQTYYGEAISKVLYPNDNHQEGKNLRLRQQYFLCAASVADICRRHMSVYGKFDNFAEKTAIHINDTHPTLAIPELMRFLLDDCGYGWDLAWSITTNTFAYTNHTVMKEAMEVWDIDQFRALLPRIYSIIREINNRHRQYLYEERYQNHDSVEEMAIIKNGKIYMANLAIAGSHNVNGVSRLHSQILKDEVFTTANTAFPGKFTNVTNGISSRRWLMIANPGLTELITEAIGDGFKRDMNMLADLRKFEEDTAFLEQMAKVRRKNKERLCKLLERDTGVRPDPDSIFDIHVKRLHEYKRQQLGALEILATYQYLKENPNADFYPRTYIFGGKAAPGYFMAKQIIKLICSLGEMIDKDPAVRNKIRVHFVEDYNVTKMEQLLPAADISEQISLAGTEASGTGNMKLMINGAVTLGTMDGANVEIFEQVGQENILIFGMTAQEVDELRAKGYTPQKYYNGNRVIKRAVDALLNGFGEETFPNINDMLIRSDYYMTLADFDSYRAIRQKSGELYRDQSLWQKMSLVNIAKSAIFCADRSIKDYARDIWRLG